jgi:hypothetical protein
MARDKMKREVEQDNKILIDKKEEMDRFLKVDMARDKMIEVEDANKILIEKKE